MVEQIWNDEKEWKLGYNSQPNWKSVAPILNNEHGIDGTASGLAIFSRGLMEYEMIEGMQMSCPAAKANATPVNADTAGITHVQGLYNFSAIKGFLIEGADEIQAMGGKVIKL